MCIFNKTILFINSLTAYLKAVQTKKLYFLLWRGFYFLPHTNEQSHFTCSVLVPSTNQEERI